MSRSLSARGGLSIQKEWGVQRLRDENMISVLGASHGEVSEGMGVSGRGRCPLTSALRKKPEET